MRPDVIIQKIGRGVGGPVLTVDQTLRGCDERSHRTHAWSVESDRIYTSGLPKLRAWTLTRSACARSAAGVSAELGDCSAICRLTHIDTVGSWGREMFRRSPSTTGFPEKAYFHAVALQGRGLATRC